MAVTKLKPVPPEEPHKDLQKELGARLGEARRQKQFSRVDIEEAYFFTMPRRLRSVSSESQSDTAPGDGDVLQTSFGFECADDFMTMIMASFMPQAGRWAERQAPPFVSKTVKAKIEKDAREQDEEIFRSIRASNFHGELAKQGMPDGAIGVFAMTVKSVAGHRPLQCLGVPIRELEFNIGPDGRIDDRFIVRKRKFCKLKGEVPTLDLPQKIKNKITDTPDAQCEITWAYWRLWDKTDDEYWQHVVTIDGEVVHKAELKGEGCCELVIGRFGATPDFAWPDGPIIKALADLRQLDDMRGAFVENFDFTLRPPFTYDADDTFNVENGIEPGMGYPRRPKASGSSIEKIYEPNTLDHALFESKDLERRIRRLHYVDFPEQVGKTPPTASQWLDEMVKAQERIGTPGYAFWREFPYDAFQRFRYLAEMRGEIQPVIFDGKRVTLQAYNPAQRAQENQEVLTATRFLQIGATAFPQIMQVRVDEGQTLENIKAKLGDKLVVLRPDKEIAAAAATVAKVAGVGGPNPPGGFAGPQGNG